MGWHVIALKCGIQLGKNIIYIVKLNASTTREQISYYSVSKDRK